jgi:photosystem II stability/assembly factor-like uncharacterized protein
MKKIFFLLQIFLLFFALNSYSQITYGWSEQNSGFTGTLWSVSPLDSSVVWVGADSAKVLKTTNGGINWTIYSVDAQKSRAIFSVYNIFGIDANNALCLGSTGAYTHVYKTSNGGLNWSAVLYQAGGFFDNIYMFSSSVGVVCGDPVNGRVSLWKTTDSGNNWDSTGMNLSAVPSEIGISNSVFGFGGSVWFGTSFGYIYYSSNFGSNWTKLLSNDYTGCIWSNSPSTGNIYFASVTDIYHSTNYGFNWTTLPATPGSGYLNGLTGIGNEFWYTKSGKTIYYSSNNGTAWSLQYTAPNNNYVHLLKARTGKYIWGVRESGKISRYGIITGVENISKSIPSEFKLYQNYPNPFNPATKIKFEIKTGGAISLKIYDIMGKEISVLVNHNLAAGSYIADFNASALPSGVYYYILKAGSFTDTKKMVLIK